MNIKKIFGKIFSIELLTIPPFKVVSSWNENFPNLSQSYGVLRIKFPS